MALALLPLAAGSTGEPFAPAAAAVSPAADDQARIVWIPGETHADVYRIYGVDATPTLLLEVPGSAGFELMALVPGPYAGYAVSGVKDGVESGLVQAAQVEEDCIDIDPPGVVVRCIPIIHEPVPLVQYRKP